MPPLPNFHDAALSNIDIRWQEKSVHIRLRYGWPPIVADLVFDDLRSISMTRNDDWGPSSHVLRIEEEPHGGASRFIVHMQSGDLIEIVASRAEVQMLEPDAPSPPLILEPPVS
jgi:hypothetical protein